MYNDIISRQVWLRFAIALMLAISALVFYTGAVAATDVTTTLTGEQEVPPVKSDGVGASSIVIATDGTVTGSVTTTGIAGTAAHIHGAAIGKNGALIVPLTKEGNTYTVPTGTKLTAEQYENLQAGNLYVNVHTTANPNGEIRGQLQP